MAHLPDRTRVVAELAELLADGWEHAERVEAGDSTILLLRGPKTGAITCLEKRTPKPGAMAGVAVVVTNDCGHVPSVPGHASRLRGRPRGART
ncbi:hypothetical protein AB0I68_38450 [Streptomyces sp. NPDC050448]|uniref:hypothetical protein n=1 Tax=Streptomyces sp. NPDC050448 TaxID=3155404 RepID=UPI003436B874